MKLIQGMIRSVFALALACGAMAAVPPTPVLLSDTTFDGASVPSWGYGYFYNNNAVGLQNYHTSFFLEEAPENGVWAYNFQIEGLEANNAWGTGTGGPLISTPEGAMGSYVSPVRDDYVFTFDARVAGLLEGQSTANAEMQVSLYSGEGKKLQVNAGFNPTAQWQTFTIPLSDGNLADNTTDAGFEASHLEVDGVRFNVNFHLPGAQFGFDTNNVLYVDNAKLTVTYMPPDGNPPPTYTRTILDWNMDDKLLWYQYSYNWSANENRPVFNGYNNDNGGSPNTYGVDNTSGWMLLMDNSSLAFETPAWAGGGTGGGGPADYSHFTSGDLANYQVSFDARVEGLNDVQPKDSTTTVLQLQIEAPDDTLQPADANTDADFLVRLDFPITEVGAAWKHYTFALNRGGQGGGSKANFEAYASAISAIRTQWQIENAASWNDWDFDGNNGFVIDNILLERIYTGLGPISYTKEGNELVLTWTAAQNGLTKLQSSDTVNGTYSDLTVSGTTYRASIEGAQRYFRLIWVDQSGG